MIMISYIRFHYIFKRDDQCRIPLQANQTAEWLHLSTRTTSRHGQEIIRRGAKDIKDRIWGSQEDQWWGNEDKKRELAAQKAVREVGRVAASLPRPREGIFWFTGLPEQVTIVKKCANSQHSRGHPQQPNHIWTHAITISRNRQQIHTILIVKK